MRDGFMPVPEKLIGVSQVANKLFSDDECRKHETCLLCPNNEICVRELKDSGVAF